MSRIATEADQIEFDNAYWAAQPPAVQKLRDMEDYLQRQMYASLLVDYNYRVDVPIMVTGWDPFKTMALRQAFLYTWTPAMGTPAIQAAPGNLTFGTIIPYDPAVPQPRAFKVSLDFDDFPPFKP